MFNLVTPCSRPEFLMTIYDSIKNQTYNNFANITWWIMLDTKRVTSIKEVNLPKSANFSIEVILDSYPSSVAGHGQRNAVLNKLGTHDWFYSIDDDNILHPNFLETVNNEIKASSDIKAVVVNQVLKNGSTRLLAAPQNTKVCSIDTAQYIVRTDLVGDTRFVETEYCADGIFIETLHKKDAESFRYVNQPFCYYNYLRP